MHIERERETNTHTHIHTHTRIHAYTHKHIHTNTHIHIRIHIHTYTHTSAFQHHDSQRVPCDYARIYNANTCPHARVFALWMRPPWPLWRQHAYARTPVHACADAARLCARADTYRMLDSDRPCSCSTIVATCSKGVGVKQGATSTYMTPHAAYEKYLNRKASSQTHLQRSHIHLARCTAHAHSPCPWTITHSQAVGNRAGGVGATTSQQRNMSSSGWWVQQLHNKTHVEEMSKVECGGHTLTPCSDWQLLMAPMTAFWDASMPFMNCATKAS